MARQSEPSPDLSAAGPAPVPVLLTRPRDEAEAFAVALKREFGSRVEPVIAPLMAVEYLSDPLPKGPFSGVIFTSATGVEAACRIGIGQTGLAWCVGRKTAERAAAAGFLALSAEGDATALVAAIRADPPAGKLLHLRGEDTRGEVMERLTSAGIETESLIVYRQRPQPLSPEGRALLATEGPVIAPLFSPRSAALLRDAAPKELRATLWLVAMSEAVAAVARTLPHQALEVATPPDARAMLEAVGRLVNRTSPP